MSKPLIILADSDEKYIATLEYRLLELLGSRVEIEIITEPIYFETYFSVPRTAEVLAVSEDMYSDSLNRHNINNVFVLIEDLIGNSTRDLSIDYVFKYGGVKEIFNELLFKSRDVIYASENTNKSTTVVAFCSAIGGSGKTSLSMGFAACLASKHQKVLYINLESVQGFAHMLSKKEPMPNEGYRAIKNSREYTYSNIKPYIKTEKFSYIQPFAYTLDSLNMDYGFYKDLICSAKASKEYDFIIIDIESGYNSSKNELMHLSDKVLIVLLQDELSKYKTNYLLSNVDLTDREKYVFVCNMYSDSKPNAYMQGDYENKITVHEYVEYLDCDKKTIKAISELRGIEKLAYLFI